MLKPYWQRPETFGASELPIFASPMHPLMGRTSAGLKSHWGCNNLDSNLVDGDPVDDDPEAPVARESRVHEECLHLVVII